MAPVHLPTMRQTTAIYPTATWSSCAADLSVRPSTSSFRPIARRNTEKSFFSLGSSTSFFSVPGKISKSSGTAACPRSNLWDSVFHRQNPDGLLRRRLMRAANDSSRGGNGGAGGSGSGSGSGSGGSGESDGDEGGGKTPSFFFLVFEASGRISGVDEGVDFCFTDVYWGFHLSVTDRKGADMGSKTNISVCILGDGASGANTTFLVLVSK